MTSSTRVVLLRHGRTAWNQELRWQGQSDIEMDEVGRSQAEAAAEVLAGYRPAKIVASPLHRAFTTATFLAQQTGLPVELDERFLETNGGVWEGLTQAEIRENYLAELTSWFTNSNVPAGLNGESRTTIAERFSSGVIDHVIEGETIVVVTHGGVARAGLLQLLGLPLDRVGVFRVLYNCGWAVLDRDDVTRDWRVSDYNLTAREPEDERHF